MPLTELQFFVMFNAGNKLHAIKHTVVACLQGLQAGVLLQLYQFLNPVKITSDPSNYRPIALTSCICKAMECMINKCFCKLGHVIPVIGQLL